MIPLRLETWEVIRMPSLIWTCTLKTFFTFFYIKKKESFGFVKIFKLWFLMDLHVLGCPEHDVTNFMKMHKKLYTKYALLEITMIQFRCV